jgi:hypothetical protein
MFDWFSDKAILELQKQTYLLQRLLAESQQQTEELKRQTKEQKIVKALLFQLVDFPIKFSCIDERFTEMKVKELLIHFVAKSPTADEDVAAHKLTLSVNDGPTEVLEFDPITLTVDKWIVDDAKVVGEYQRLDAVGNASAPTVIDFIVKDTVAPTAGEVNYSAIAERVVDVPDPEPTN